MTLVHKGAMPIALIAVESFCRLHQGDYQLLIHNDGSLDNEDKLALLAATGTMPARIVEVEERRAKVLGKLATAPLTAKLTSKGGYFTKLEIPVFADGPFFFFDSDIAWLRKVEGLRPRNAPNAFSTETWSWYYGVRHSHLWVKAKTPRRVNSGFYFLGELFPVERMEKMLARGMFDSETYGNTDQEIMAYLFPKLEYYDAGILKRSRVGRVYNVSEETCAALHFPGRMWQEHLDQLAKLPSLPGQEACPMVFHPPVPLTDLELWRMHALLWSSKSRLLQPIIKAYRAVRAKASTSK